MRKAKQQLVLDKGVERFVFTYQIGEEGSLLDILAEQAEDRRTRLDLLDAAVLSIILRQSFVLVR